MSGFDVGRTLPRRYQQRQYLQIVVVMAITAGIVMAWFTDSPWLYSINLWLVYSIGTLGFYFIFGMAGRFAFCQATFLALGAYTTLWAQRHHVELLLALLIAAVISAAVSLVIAAAVIRGPAFAFGIATFAITEIGIVVLSHWTSFAGLDGTAIRFAIPEVFGLDLSGPTNSFWMLLVGLSLALLLGAWIERSPMSRDAIAARELPLTAAVIGVPGQRVHTVLFAVSAAYGAVAGGLFAEWIGFASIQSFGFDFAVLVFLVGIVGGRTSIWGPVIGSGIFVALPHLLEKAPEVQDLIYGIVLLVAIIVFPNGFSGSAHLVSDFCGRLRPRGAGQS